MNKTRVTTSIQELVRSAEVPNPVSHAQHSAELTSEVSKVFKLCLFLNDVLKSMQAAHHADSSLTTKKKRQLGEQQANGAWRKQEFRSYPCC